MTSGVDHADGDMQPHGNIETHDNNVPNVNRLASLRLHQALIQSHDKQWTSHNDVRDAKQWSSHNDVSYTKISCFRFKNQNCKEIDKMKLSTKSTEMTKLFL